MSTIRHVVFIEFTKRASPVERSFILFLRYVTSEFLLRTADQVLFLCTRQLTRSLREHGEKNKKSVSSGSPNFCCPRPVSIFDLRQIQCNSLPQWRLTVSHLHAMARSESLETHCTFYPRSNVVCGTSRRKHVADW